MLQGQLLLENRQKIQIPNDMKHRHLQLLFSLHSQKSTASPWLSYPQQLQQVVHDIQKSTAEWLFSQVLVDRHSLERYLYSFRQMFLLGHGDLAVNLIEECSHWRRRSILRSGDKRSSSGQSSDRESTRSSSHKSASTIFRHQELNALLVKASVGTDAEDTLHGYSLRILDDSQETGFADLLLMDAQCWLTYEMRWPIDLFLSEADLARYGELWCFLIGLRSVQMSLSGLWQYLRGGKESDRSEQWIHKGNHGNDEEGFEERLIWRLRSRMIFWVDALWSHMQANVINTHYENLIDMVSPCSEQSKKRRSVSKPATLDFEEIQVAHDDYLGNITRGCLLTSSRCSEAMNHTLRTCVDFCELVKQLSEDEEWLFRKRRKTTKTASEIVRQWTQPSTLAQNPWIHRICELEEIFNSSTELFFELITHQSQEVKSSGNLDLLLMQLDYNNWYSK
ncbi:Spc98 family-domain-containing protein [Radiomyces spectabilis]|uniref:Spc98 family-domain-containing protein n=1 Tax=Radiomyces spectabilis TaxID=64574 RepID=UPI00221F7DEC|nr:Spc98 family-domain-containing protein [Radiomyces spectabilis]KAI8390941.1 Spc98 family-domain-containing protein [Radiomyces spectabilis]